MEYLAVIQQYRGKKEYRIEANSFQEALRFAKQRRLEEARREATLFWAGCPIIDMDCLNPVGHWEITKC